MLEADILQSLVTSDSCRDEKKILRVNLAPSEVKDMQINVGLDHSCDAFACLLTQFEVVEFQFFELEIVGEGLAKDVCVAN